jgi:FtsH-binding integral membrane protein
MDLQSRKLASTRTVQILGTALFAFHLGGYVTRFSWSNWGWVATVITIAALVVVLFLSIRDYWRPRGA